LKEPQRRETAKQGVGDLGHRENKYQIEKQFGVGDATVLVRHERAKQRAAVIFRHPIVPRAPDV